MKNIILLIVSIFLSIVYVVLDETNTTFFYSTPEINVKDSSGNINSIDLEEYVIGVVAAEMPASFNEEALKAQAIAARTYATYKMKNSNKNYDIVTSVANQGFITLEKMKSKWKDDFTKYYNKVKKAVEDTKGMVMYYEDEVVEAYYFAMSNGYTEDVSLVFSESKDYLKSVPSKYDTLVKNFTVTKSFSKENFCKKINITCNTIVINDIKRSDTNRVNYITINNKTYKGTEFRKILGLRSTDFEIKIEDDIKITTRGYGHGVGMSQYGANGMAKDGYSYEEILNYYYKNIKISTI